MFLPFAMFSAMPTASARRAFRRGSRAIDQGSRIATLARRPPLRARCLQGKLSQCGTPKDGRSYRCPSALVEPGGPEVGLVYTATSGGLYADYLLVAAAGFAAFATPSLAAEFYIVQDTTTKRCTIVEQRPTSQTMVVVGPGMAFTTRSEAETSMKTVKGCESGGTVGGPVAPAVPR